MLQDVADDRDGVEYILVFKLSRFGRNAADVLNSLQYIQDFGVNLICVEDGIGDIDDQLRNVNEKIQMAFEMQITSKQVYQILTCFDKIYFEMMDLEKKEFFRNFIDEIELYSERQSDGRIVKQINFNFPVYYKGKEGDAIRLPEEKTVESVTSLQMRG